MTRLVTDPHGYRNDVTNVCCLACGGMVVLAHAIVDLDGPPFQAYYHTDCAPEGPVRTLPAPPTERY